MLGLVEDEEIAVKEEIEDRLVTISKDGNGTGKNKHGPRKAVVRTKVTAGGRRKSLRMRMLTRTRTKAKEVRATKAVKEKREERARITS